MYLINLILVSILFLVFGYIAGVRLTHSYLQGLYKSDKNEFNRYLKIKE